MPGFFITNIESNKKYVLEKNNEFLSQEILNEKYIIKRSILKSYLDDKIFSEDKELIVITDGIIYDSDTVFENKSIRDAFFINYKEDPLFFSKLNGHFSGAFYDKQKDEWLVYTSCFGDRSIFYYYNVDDGTFIIGSELRYVVDFMRICGIERTIDEHGMKCLLDFGYFLDESTGVNEIKRLFPGDYLIVNREENIKIGNYFNANYKPVEYEENKAIENLDKAFSNALKRIIEKNKFNKKYCIADLSGGLDSRMICYGLNKINAENIFTATYAQSESYEQKIAQKIAQKLGFESIFLSLDTGLCLLDIDELTLLNNGTSYYFGITGGEILLDSLNTNKFGIELTGILGDIHESAIIEYKGDKNVNVHDERFKLSSKTALDLDYNYSKVSNRFRDNEMYWFYIRGALAGLSTFHIRRNYIEPVTPFADKEFLEAYLSIPWDIRCREKLLLRWMIKKYPEAVKFPYGATGMSVLNENDFSIKIIRRIKFYCASLYSKLRKAPVKNNMNPMDFWLSSNPKLKTDLNEYYSSNKFVLDEYIDISKQVDVLFKSESFIDKGLALFIISYVKNYIK